MFIHHDGACFLIKRGHVGQCMMVIFSLCLMAACSTPGKGLFGGKTAHERYGEKLAGSGLKETALGLLWFTAASKGLLHPVAVKLPYKETGYFDATRPEAAGYRFTARRGDKLLVTFTKKPVTNFALFVDLWQPVVNGQPKFLSAADTTNASLSYDIEKDGDYLLRLQPELLAGGEYTLIIRTGPSLGFPVAVAARPKISSFWGDARDAGARSHEGIDIFGARRTHILAAADGSVTSVTLNKLGGKVVFMRPKGKDFVLYYAHLDSQMVESGQRVKAGDTIGLMGNTGNAITTPPHLHFGIYATGGAIDPLPFVDTKRAEPADITAPVASINLPMRSIRNAVVHTMPDKQAAKVVTPVPGTLLQVIAATGSWYKVQLPDGREGFVYDGSVQAMNTPIKTVKLDSSRALLDKPDILAASKTSIDKGTSIPVLATFNNFYYVNNGVLSGWLVSE